MKTANPIDIVVRATRLDEKIRKFAADEVGKEIGDDDDDASVAALTLSAALAMSLGRVIAVTAGYSHQPKSAFSVLWSSLRVVIGNYGERLEEGVKAEEPEKGVTDPLASLLKLKTDLRDFQAAKPIDPLAMYLLREAGWVGDAGITTAGLAALAASGDD